MTSPSDHVFSRSSMEGQKSADFDSEEPCAGHFLTSFGPFTLHMSMRVVTAFLFVFLLAPPAVLAKPAAGQRRPASDSQCLPAQGAAPALCRIGRTSAGVRPSSENAMSFRARVASQIIASRRFQAEAIARVRGSRPASVRARRQPVGLAAPVEKASTKDLGARLPFKPAANGFDCAAVVDQSPDVNNPGCYPVSDALRRRFEQRR